MSRPLRIQYPDAWYHVMNRGKRREVIFSTKSLNGIRRGIINEPGNVAIYLTRCLRHDSLKEIGKEFDVPNYSSVSSIIESMKANLAGNKKLKKRNTLAF